MAHVCRRGGPPVGHATGEAPRRCASAAVAAAMARFLANTHNKEDLKSEVKL